MGIVVATEVTSKADQACNAFSALGAMGYVVLVPGATPDPGVRAGS